MPRRVPGVVGSRPSGLGRAGEGGGGGVSCWVYF